MKIYIKDKRGKHFKFRVPLFLLKFLTSSKLVALSKRYLKGENLKYVEAINFEKLRGAIEILKEYKGLELVDVKEQDGAEVKIVV